MRPLTPRQKQAYDLRQSGLKIAEIARIMGTTREPVRQWIAAAEWKLSRTPTRRVAQARRVTSPAAKPTAYSPP